MLHNLAPKVQLIQRPTRSPASEGLYHAITVKTIKLNLNVMS
jgi:hypothetical protein